MQYAVKKVLKNNDTKSIIYCTLGFIIESLELNFPMVLIFLRVNYIPL